MDFVAAFEHKKVSLVLEAHGYLGPYCAKLRNNLLLTGGIAGRFLDVEPVFAVRSVVVDVYDGVEPGIFRVADNLGNPFQPGLIKLIIRSFSYVSEPGDRDAHGLESRLCNGIESRLGSLCIAPAGLRSHTIGMGIHLIAKVPAYFQLLRYCPGCIVILDRPVVSRFLSHFDIDFFITADYGNLAAALLFLAVLLYLHGDSKLVVSIASLATFYPLVPRRNVRTLVRSDNQFSLATFCRERQFFRAYTQLDRLLRFLLLGFASRQQQSCQQHYPFDSHFFNSVDNSSLVSTLSLPIKFFQ